MTKTLSFLFFAFLCFHVTRAQTSAVAIPLCDTGIAINFPATVVNRSKIVLRDSPPRPFLNFDGTTRSDTTRLVAFYMLSDSSYYRRTMAINTDGCPTDTIEHLARTSAGGTVRVEVAYSALYSPDRPPKRVTAARVTTPGAGQTLEAPTWSAFTNNLDRLVKIEPQYDRSRPGDTMAIALSYRALSQDADNNDPTPVYFNGEIVLFDPSETTYEVVDPGAIKVRNGVYKWPIANLRDGRERTFFTKIVTNRNIKPDSNILDKPLIAYLVTEGTDWVSLAEISTGGSSQDQSFGNDGGFIIKKTAPQSFKLPIETNRLVDTYERPLTVASALDPNDIIFEPKCWDKKSPPERLNAKVTFFNSGMAGADTVRVETRLNPPHYRPLRAGFSCWPLPNASIKLDSSHSRHLFIDRFSGVGAVVLSSIEEVKEATEGGARTTPGAIVPPVDYAAHPNVGGYVQFDLFPVNPLPPTDSLSLNARIFMGNSHLSLNKAIPVGCEYRYPVRWQHGMKIIYYGAADNWLDNGLGARYVVRMPLSRSFPTSSNQIFPSLRELPEWWLQWEAGISRLKFNGNNASYTGTYIDITPFQILYAPRFENRPNRPLGILAGYTASFLAASNPKLPVKFEHNIDFAVEALNVLGRPGIAVGAGISLRIPSSDNPDIGLPESYWYPSVFIRHNFAVGFDYRY